MTTILLREGRCVNHENEYIAFRVLAAPQLPTFTFGSSATAEPPMTPPEEGDIGEEAIGEPE